MPRPRPSGSRQARPPVRICRGWAARVTIRAGVLSTGGVTPHRRWDRQTVSQPMPLTRGRKQRQLRHLERFVPPRRQGVAEFSTTRRVRAALPARGREDTVSCRVGCRPSGMKCGSSQELRALLPLRRRGAREMRHLPSFVPRVTARLYSPAVGARRGPRYASKFHEEVRIAV
jgi:hypothetical protein